MVALSLQICPREPLAASSQRNRSLAALLLLVGLLLLVCVGLELRVGAVAQGFAFEVEPELLGGDGGGFFGGLAGASGDVGSQDEVWQA